MIFPVYALIGLVSAMPMPQGLIQAGSAALANKSKPTGQAQAGAAALGNKSKPTGLAGAAGRFYLT
jgi:hypothetical protein